MRKETKANGTTDIWSDQRSGDVQFERTSTWIRKPDNKKIDVVLGYRRSLDFDAKDNPGQDYAAVRADAKGHIVGVVADGVSQSFYGHLAAYHLSRSLLNTLWQERTQPPSGDTLEAELNVLEKEVASDIVESYPIPGDLAQLHKEALEDKRSSGSQAVFAAFVLDAARKRLYLYQVGDVGAIVHYSNKKPEDIQASSKGRWSSAGKSEMRLQLTTFEGERYPSGIVIKSDGVGHDWGLTEQTFDESAFALLSKERAGIDDMSFVAARWGAWVYAPQIDDAEGPPRIESVSPPRPRDTEVLPGTRPYVSSPPAPVTPSHSDLYNTTRDPRAGGNRHRHRVSVGRSVAALLLIAGVAAGIVIGTLVVTVGPAIIGSLFLNDPPVAKNDAYSMELGQPRLERSASHGVLANDSDDEEGKLYVQDTDTKAPGIQPLQQPANGRLNLDRDGSFTYVPTTDSPGTDSFKYRTSDGTGVSDTIGKATISVIPGWRSKPIGDRGSGNPESEA
jgi:hypothetical protein